MLGSRIAAGIVMLHGFDVAEHGASSSWNSAVRLIESPPRPGRPGRRWCGRASLCLQDGHYRQYIGQIAVDAIHAMRLERRVNRACRTGCEDAEFDRDVDLPIDDLEDIGSPFGRVAPRQPLGQELDCRAFGIGNPHRAMKLREQLRILDDLAIDLDLDIDDALGQRAMRVEPAALRRPSGQEGRRRIARRLLPHIADPRDLAGPRRDAPPAGPGGRAPTPPPPPPTYPGPARPRGPPPRRAASLSARAG